MFSAIRTIFHGDPQGKTVFDPPYTPEEERVVTQLQALGEAAADLRWSLFVLVTEAQEQAFRQGVRIGLNLAQELTDPDDYL